MKSQLAVDEATGEVDDVPSSDPRSTADLTVPRRSRVLGKVKRVVAVVGDLAYLGADK